MKGVLHFLAVLAMAGVAFGAYRVNYETQQVLDGVAEIRTEIQRERDTLEVLRAEWAYLNGPIRLAALADEKVGQLGLQPMRPEQFGIIGALPDRLNGPSPQQGREMAILAALYKASLPPMLVDGVRAAPRPAPRPSRKARR